MKYKVNDIVVVTESYGNNSAKIGITGILKKIDSLKPKFCIRNESKDVFNSYCQEVRKATIEEIEQYVKDNNCNINEILEICKNYYKEGQEIISAGKTRNTYKYKVNANLFIDLVRNKENNNSKSISKVQGFDKQITSSSGARGIGLTSSRSKITLGTVNKPNKVGLSTCK